MTREEILKAAHQCVCGDREEDYGNPEDNFKTISVFWYEYIRSSFGVRLAIKPDDVALMMALLKIARMTHGKKADNCVDLAGYAACAGEIATGGDAP